MATVRTDSWMVGCISILSFPFILIFSLGSLLLGLLLAAVVLTVLFASVLTLASLFCVLP